MITQNLDFDSLSSSVQELSKVQELFESCAQLIADSLVGDGKVFCVGKALTAASARQLSEQLACNPEQLRPPLPAIFLDANEATLQKLQALGNEGDFAILFAGPLDNQSLDSWLDACLSIGITSVLICPDISGLESTDKALEIRLEYQSISSYLTMVSALCSFLTSSVEIQLFGRQD